MRTHLPMAVVLCILLGACADSYRETSAGRQPAAAGSGERNGQAGGPSAPATKPLVLGDPGSPEDTQVWIGELWTIASVLCDPLVAPEDGRYDPGKTHRVVLILEPGRNGERSGRIRIGDPQPLPESPCVETPAPNCVQLSQFWQCSNQLATGGFEYTLFDVGWTGSQLRFSYAPNEVWNQWCVTAKPSCTPFTNCTEYPYCRCESGACTADLRARDTIRLTATRDTLEGLFHDTQSNVIRLRRVR